MDTQTVKFTASRGGIRYDNAFKENVFHFFASTTRVISSPPTTSLLDDVETRADEPVDWRDPL